MFGIPEVPFIKVNCDGSWFPDSKRTCFGFVANDSAGYVVGARAEFKDKMQSSLEAEAFAILLAMRCADSKLWNSCIFVTDNVDVFNLLSRGSGTSCKIAA